MLVDTSSIRDLRRGLSKTANLREDETRAARPRASAAGSRSTRWRRLTRLYAELAGAERLEEAARALLVSPDYASHYLPLSALGQALALRGHDVVVATCPPRRARACRWLRAPRARARPREQPGLARESERPAGEAAHLSAFLAATRAGMVATLRLQAEARLRDLPGSPRR